MKQKTRILILEDVAADAELIKTALKKAKLEFTASVVSRKKDFLKQLSEFSPEIILLDYSLPQFDGLSAMKIALEELPHVPCIIVTGSLDEETAVDCMKSGAADYVLKNNLVRLAPAVNNALEKKQALERQHQAEKALRQSEEHFRSLVENISEVFYVVDAAGKVAYGSPNLFASTGYHPEELLGHSYTRMIYELDRRQVVEFYKTRTADGSLDSLCEFRAQPKRGKPIWVEQATRIVRDAKGNVIEYRNIVRNITERKLAELALSKLTGAIEQTADRVLITDQHGVIEYVNPAFEMITGYSRESVIGKKPSILKSGQHDMAFYKDLWDTILSKKTFRAEFINKKQNGQLYHEEQTISPILDGQGNIIHFVSTAKDISDRKQAEERIKWLASFPELNRSPVIEIDEAGTIHYVNKAATEWFPDLQKLGMQHPLLTDWKEVTQKVQAVLTGHIVLEPRIGSRHYQQTIFYVGETGRIRMYILDITERKTADAQLLFQSMLLDQVRQAVISGDEDSRITYWNSFAEKMYGWSETEVLGKNFFRVLVPEESLKEAKRFLSLVVKSGYAEGEITVRRKDGRTLPVQFTASVVADETGKTIGFVTGGIDVTERKKSAEALRESEARLKNIVESSTNLFYAHDVNQKLYFLSPQVKEILGYEVEEARRRWTEFASTHPINELGIQSTMRAIETGKPQPPYELELVHKTGRKVWVEVREAPVVKDGRTVAIVGSLTDITERRISETVLLESEKRFRELFDDAPIGYHEIDSSGIITRVNRTECEMLGYTPEEMVGKHAWEFSAEPEVSRKAVERKFSGKDPLKPFERVFVRKDGSTFPVSVQDRYLINEKGNIAGIRTTVQDITEQKKAQDELLRQTANFRQLFDSSPAAIALLDETDKVVDINAAFTEIFHYTLGELKGKSLSDFILPQDQKDEADELAKLYKQGDAVLKEVVRMRKNGERVDVALTSYSIIINNARAGSYRIYQDISERKKAEQEILKQSSYFRQLFDSSPAAIVLVDPNDHVLDINHSFTELFQYTLEEIKGRSLNDCIAPVNRKSEADDISHRTLHGKIAAIETVRKRKNGENIEVALTGYPILIDEKLVGVYAIYTDISGSKRLEEQLRQSQKLESLGTLAGGIAHDFNNILGIILGHITLLERMPSDPEKIKSSTGAITRATQRGAALVRQLLTFARKTDASTESVRVNDIAKEIEKLLRETFPKIVEVKLQLDEKVSPIVGDATQVHQILLNLCVNARDAMMPKGGTLTIATKHVAGSVVKERLPVAEANMYVCLNVSDTGTGMDEATRQRIFEPFFTTKEMGKGTGLGLATVYGIVQNHGGLIDVETELGKGTTFSVYFPLQTTPEVQEEQESVKSIEIAGGPETILLVEDEDMLRELATMVLKSKGYDVLTARDGAEGLSIYLEHKNKIALVLSDMGLPKMGGFDMYKEMKKSNPTLKAVLASGYIEPGLKSEVFKAGVNDFVQKPFNPAVLLKKIRNALDGEAQK